MKRMHYYNSSIADRPNFCLHRSESHFPQAFSDTVLQMSIQNREGILCCHRHEGPDRAPSRMGKEAEMDETTGRGDLAGSVWTSVLWTLAFPLAQCKYPHCSHQLAPWLPSPP